MREPNSQLMLGAYRSNGQWLWDNGVPVEVDAWAPEEPNFGDALQIYGSDRNYGLDDYFGWWYDNPFVCEK